VIPRRAQNHPDPVAGHDEFRYSVVRARERFVFASVISVIAAQGVMAATAALAADDYGLFSGLWGWMQILCFWLLALLRWLEAITGNWGVAIILVAVLVKIVTYPLARRALIAQKRFNEINERLKPALREIKSRFKGGEQSERILALYKQHEVSPLAGIKPLFIVMLQLPIFVALFQILERAPNLDGASFLWVKDLSQPDRLFPLGFDIPWMGGYFCMLPFLLALSVVLAGGLAPGSRHDSNRAKRMWASLGMALAFFVGFYPFAAGLMIYWITNNLLQLLQQLLVEFKPATPNTPTHPDVKELG